MGLAGLYPLIVNRCDVALPMDSMSGKFTASSARVHILYSITWRITLRAPDKASTHRSPSFIVYRRVHQMNPMCLFAR